MIVPITQIEEEGSSGSEKVDPGALFRAAQQCTERGDYPRACQLYQAVLGVVGDDADVLSRLGELLCRLGRFKEAEGYLRRAIEIASDDPGVCNNLGLALRVLGRYGQAEVFLRRALELQPADESARMNLAHTLLLLGHSTEAANIFSAVLSVAPHRQDALVGLGHVAKAEGRFEDAEGLFRKALQVNPQLPGVWAALTSLRRMTRADGWWLQGAEEIAGGKLGQAEEAGLLFAIGKYWDDLGEFPRAFHSYRRANELLKTMSTGYNRTAREAYVDDMVRVYTRRAIAEAAASGLRSSRPVLVCGMPRSGTTLVEQIIASHPQAAGAGELGFWTEVLLADSVAIRQALLPPRTRRSLGEAYLKVLADRPAAALRVVDKAPINSEMLGLISTVIPDARIVYVRRNPIDTCLSCYFQYLPPSLSFTMDLGDLAHYYREHHRLIGHWRDVLPQGSILEVPYEGLVSEQEVWSRKIIAFVGLDWDARCLDFHKASRTIVTSSSWQARQKVYRDSLERWRHYEEFLGPLGALHELADFKTH